MSANSQIVATWVCLGGAYRHISGVVMKVEAASVPELDDFVKLIDMENYCKQDIFFKGWRGSWQDFLDQWHEVTKVPFKIEEQKEQEEQMNQKELDI